MKAWIQIVAFLLCCLCPLSARGEDVNHIIDNMAGYTLTLPAGWQEVSAPEPLAELARRVCFILTSDNIVAHATHMRGAFLPGDERALPALVVFALSFSTLNLDEEAVRNMAENSEAVTAGLANAMQTLYMKQFPHSMLVNSHLGNDFFSLNVRTILDINDQDASTRNRHLKMIFTAERVLVLMTVYNGPPDADYDVAIARCVREMLLAPDKALQQVIPPGETSATDYLLIIAAIIFAVIVIGKLRRFMRG